MNNITLSKKNKLKYLVAAVSIMLTACGGGGGDGPTMAPIVTPKPTPTPPPGATYQNEAYYNASLQASLEANSPQANNAHVTVNGTDSDKNIGLYSENGGKVTNNSAGIIDVVSGAGIHAFGANSSGENSGIINVKDKSGNSDMSIGLYAENGAKVTNNSTGVIEVVSGVGIHASDKESSGHNFGTINENDDSWTITYAMAAANGGKITNEKTGVINVNYQTGMKVLDRHSTAVNYGTINLNNFGANGMNAQAGQVINESTGVITGNSGGVGIFIAGVVEGDTLYGGSGINRGNITLTGDNAIGMFSQAGNITNEAGGVIKMEGDNAVGMSIAHRGTLTNNGKIILSGDNSKGIVIDGKYAKGINNGTIDLTGATNSIGIYLSNGGVFVNNGHVTKGVLLGAAGNNNKVDATGKIGTDIGDGVSFDQGSFNTNDLGDGKFIMSKNGTLSAQEIIGDIYVDSSKIAEIYNETAKSEGALIADSLDVNIISDSVMYNAEYKRNSSADYSFDILVERKQFDEVITNNSYSELLQNNIYDSNNSFKDEVYQQILSSTTIDGANSAFSNIIGDKVFPTVQKINYTQLADRNDHINDIAYKNSFGDSFKNDEVVYFADYSYNYLDSNSSSTMHGYNENRNTALLGAHTYINDSLRLGGALSIGKSDVDFNNNSTNLDSTNYHLAPFALYKNKQNNFIFSPYFGYMDGELERDLGLPSRLKSDVDTQYYGFYSEINRDIDFDSFYMKPKFEINGAQFTQKAVNESSNGGVNIPETDYSTFTTGIGSSIGKKITLDSGYTVAVELNGTYYHEFGNPNNNIEDVTLDGFNGNTSFESFKNNRDYGKVGAEITVSKNDIQGYAKYGYTIGQDSDDQKVTVGVSYKF